MKRAEAFEVHTRFAQLHVVADNLDDVDGAADFLGVFHDIAD